MIELKYKRSLNSKHFLKDDSQLEGQFHAGHIHYENKLGFGDGEKGLRSIDYTLLWDEARKGWYFNYGSFNPFIPEYADQTSTFRDLFEDKDQVVSYTPQCQHIKGRIVKGDDLHKEKLFPNVQDNCVLYDNAFGDGIDLLYSFTAYGLQKLVRIRKGVKEDDYTFKFEVSFPEDVYRAESKEKVEEGYKLDIKKSKEFDTAKNILIGDKGKGEWATYIRPFKVWTCGVDLDVEPFSKKISYIKADFVYDNGKTYLVKKISKDLFDGRTMFTDTETTYYSATADGWSGRQSFTNWAGLIVGSGSFWGPTTGETDNAFEEYRKNQNQARRGWYIFDTSGIGSGATISAAVFSVYVNSKHDGGSDAPNLTVCAAASDGAYLSNGTTELTDSRYAYANINTSAYLDSSLNAAGLAVINKTGTTYLSFVNQNYYLANSDPGSEAYWEYAGNYGNNSTNKPKLVVTYSTGSTLDVDVATVNVTGQTIGLLSGKKLIVDVDTATVSGQAIGLLSGKNISVNNATLNVVGQDIGLLTGNYAISVDVATVNVAGQDIDFKYNRIFSVDKADVSVAGQDIDLLFKRLLAVDYASVNLSGQDITISKGYPLSVDYASASVAGQDINFLTGKGVLVETATISVIPKTIKIIYWKEADRNTANWSSNNKSSSIWTNLD